MNPKDGYEPAAGRTINSKTAAAFLAPYRTDDMFKLSDKVGARLVCRAASQAACCRVGRVWAHCT